ncbi:GSCOCG00004349001-RA-CDS [Cotesia congregata]|nr:GSCOCG00004349001-RA-CDS [Cotesia congregata]
MFIISQAHSSLSSILHTVCPVSNSLVKIIATFTVNKLTFILNFSILRKNSFI